MMGWQWHQLDHMQIICASLQLTKILKASCRASQTVVYPAVGSVACDREMSTLPMLLWTGHLFSALC